MTMCYSDIETREAIRRLKEVAFTFGYGCSDYRADTDVDVTADIRVLQKFLALLRQRETKRHPWFGKSPQLKYRRHMLDFVMKVCAAEGMTSETTYQAIYLIDRFMDQHDIVPNQLGYIATVCISISGKLLETSNTTPRYSKLVRNLKEVCRSTTRHLADLEKYVLDAFSFDILVPTEVNFLEVYLLYVVDGKHAVSEDTNNNNNNTVVPNANYPDGGHIDEEEQFSRVVGELMPSQRVRGIAELSAMNELSFLILQEITRIGAPNNNFAPSRTAAAILMAARREHGLNFWTPTLQKVTSYSLDQVYQCLRTYVEPTLEKLTLSEPFNPPTFLNVVFQPYIVIEEEVESDQSF